MLLIQIGAFIEKLIGNGYVSEYLRKSFKTKYLKAKLCNTNVCYFLMNIFSKFGSDSNKNFEKKNDKSESQNDDQDLFQSAFNDLLIWSVLTRRHKMAMFFLKRGDETLAKV